MASLLFLHVRCKSSHFQDNSLPTGVQDTMRAVWHIGQITNLDHKSAMFYLIGHKYNNECTQCISGIPSDAQLLAISYSIKVKGLFINLPEGQIGLQPYRHLH